MKTTIIDHIFITITSWLIRHNSLGVISVLFVLSVIFFLFSHINYTNKHDESQKRWQNEYNTYLIDKFESQSDPMYLIDRQLVYFVIFSGVGMNTEIRSIRKSLDPPEVNDNYSVWFSEQAVGQKEVLKEGIKYSIHTRKKDTFLYQMAYEKERFIWPLILKINAFFCIFFLFLYFILWIFKHYYIKPIQNIAIEAFQNATLSFPKELSLEQYPYIQYIIESINRLVAAVKNKEQEIRHYERSRFVVDSAKRITHNISNLLNPIDFHIEQLPAHVRQEEHLKKVESQFKKIQEQISQLKKLNSNIINKELYFVGSIVELIITQLDYIGIKINFKNSSSSNGKCLIDPELIHDALYNVIKNAVESSYENEFKSIEIDLSNDVTFILITIINKVPSDYKLNVFDIFEPFLSSKSEGLGIGASVSKRILELHNGELSYQQKQNTVITRVKIPKIEEL